MNKGGGGWVRQCGKVFCCCIFKAFLRAVLDFLDTYFVVVGLFLPKTDETFFFKYLLNKFERKNIIKCQNVDKG